MHDAPRNTRPADRTPPRAALACALCVAAHAFAGGPHHPFPQHVAYAPGTIKPSHRTQAQLDADVALAYTLWKSRYVVPAGTTPAGQPRYRVTMGTSNPGRTVSEGQGFGMVTVAYMAGHDPNAQTVFDGLWHFTRANPSVGDPRLMAWQVPQGSGGEQSAFDGDCDMAYALLVADAQWGSSTAAGAVNYRAEFDTLIAGILQSTIGPTSRLPLLGDWVSPNGGQYNQWSVRSSDFMYGHFRAFGRALAGASPASATAWGAVLVNTQAAAGSIQANHSAATGLLPDFMVRTSTTNTTPVPAPAGFLEGANDGRYYYNAFRDPLRIGTDALVNNDATSLAQARKMTDWFAQTAGGVPTNLRAGYTLSGTPVSGSSYFTSVVAAPCAVAAMTRPAQQAWLNALYDSVVTRHENYYEDSVTLLSLIVLSGNWWDPTLVAPPSCAADFDGDGSVNGADLGALLSQWGAAPGGGADLDGDGTVNGADLGALLAQWGPC